MLNDGTTSLVRQSGQCAVLKNTMAWAAQTAGMNRSAAIMGRKIAHPHRSTKASLPFTASSQEGLRYVADLLLFAITCPGPHFQQVTV